MLTCDRDDHYTRDRAAPYALHLRDDYADPDPLVGRAPQTQLVHLVGGDVAAMDALEVSETARWIDHQRSSHG